MMFIIIIVIIMMMVTIAEIIIFPTIYKSVKTFSYDHSLASLQHSNMKTNLTSSQDGNLSCLVVVLHIEVVESFLRLVPVMLCYRGSLGKDCFFTL